MQEELKSKLFTKYGPQPIDYMRVAVLPEFCSVVDVLTSPNSSS